MKLLEDRIKKDGVVLPGNILKVNSFLNHQIDVSLLDSLAENFKKAFEGVELTKIVTIEASGIAVACAVARAFGNLPVLFAKKHKSAALSDDVYYATVWSHTNSCNYNIVISKDYISSEDKILLVDDFLADGNAMNGLIEIAENAGAKIQGVCVAVEKSFQLGGDSIRKKGIRVESGAVIERMTYNGDIDFKN
ncbi:xanthine phosphoribosyltransferase [Treponema sp.]|uniref:xanthine phosphoribosyltransferase n=1 Tax=Treponema sp. TaxID=166 RepID=UPI003F126C40